MWFLLLSSLVSTLHVPHSMTAPESETKSFDDGSSEIIGACIEIHRHLGPGLLESAYEQCLAHELTLRRIPFARQVHLPLRY